MCKKDEKIKIRVYNYESLNTTDVNVLIYAETKQIKRWELLCPSGKLKDVNHKTSLNM